MPTYFLADEKHSRCLTEKVYLPTIVSGRVLWHLGYTEEASAAALTASYGMFHRAASQHEPSYRVKGVLTDGFDSTTKSLRTLFLGVRVGICLRHALLKLPKKLAAIASPVRKALRAQFHTLLYRARQRKHLRVFARNPGECENYDVVCTDARDMVRQGAVGRASVGSILGLLRHAVKQKRQSIPPRRLMFGTLALLASATSAARTPPRLAHSAVAGLRATLGIGKMIRHLSRHVRKSAALVWRGRRVYKTAPN